LLQLWLNINALKAMNRTKHPYFSILAVLFTANGLRQKNKELHNGS